MHMRERCLLILSLPPPQALGEIEIAIKLVRSERQDHEHPLDQHYRRLGCELCALDRDTHDFQVGRSGCGREHLGCRSLGQGLAAWALWLTAHPLLCFLQVLEQYLLTTHAPTHRDYSMELLEAFALRRPSEETAFRADLPNRSGGCCWVQGRDHWYPSLLGGEVA